ncbi:MAG: hypothetical protein J6W60_08230, partial [Treponema sp.]|nr:hypothetical protein [Treponema sp.]
KPDAFSPELAAVLVNSLYFESPWSHNWSVQQRVFTNLEGKTTSQDMLVDLGLEQYFENEYCTAFAKRYYNGFEFIGILPKEEGDFSLSDLDLKSLMESRTGDYDVRAIMPKLEFETTAENVVDILRAEGVLKIFEPTCTEFDKMVEGKPLYVSDILQKCKIELDEEGTRAAAVTVIMAKDTAAFIEPVQREIKEVFLDRPFAFLIYDSTNDQILFTGKVTDIQKLVIFHEKNTITCAARKWRKKGHFLLRSVFFFAWNCGILFSETKFVSIGRQVGEKVLPICEFRKKSVFTKDFF